VQAETDSIDRKGNMHRRRIHGGTALATALIATGLLVPAGATAAPAAPGVSAAAAANVGQNSATLRGGVTPNELPTQYWFEYGTTRSYGTRVPDPPGDAGRGNSRVPVRADIGGLAPATTYHYRVVARNSRGTRRSADRTFRTQRQPLGISLGAAPNPVPPGGNALIGGTLSGTGNSGRQVVLQSNPFPYTQGFQNAADTHLTNADGTFTFPVLSLALNTQYRVVLPNQPQVQSPIVTIGVAPRVSLGVRRTSTAGRGSVFRFTGSVTPAHDGAEIAIQRLRRGTWVTVAGTIAKHRSRSASRYRKTVRLRRGGTYRVFAGTNDGDHVQSVSRSVKLRVR
jgi:hypothetical protein